IEQTSKQVAELKAQHQNIAHQLATAETASKGHEADFDAAKKAFADAQSKSQTAAAEAAKSKTEVDRLSAEIQIAGKVVATLDPVMPVLKEASAMGVQAAAKLAGDKEIAAAAE